MRISKLGCPTRWDRGCSSRESSASTRVHRSVVLLAALALTCFVLPGIGASGAGAVTTPTVSSPPDQLVGMGDGYVDVPVTLSAPGQSTVTVSYATANATAAAGTSCDNEYVAASGTLTFTPGQTTQTVRVGLNNCKITGFYFFSFNLSSPVGATIVRPQSVIDIVGDAAGSGTPQLEPRAATVDASAGSVLVPVLLNGTAGQASTSTVTVGYATADGSAKAGTDYTSTSGTLTFVPGETVQNVSVPILDPSGSKPTRSFTLTLSSPTNATLGQVTATVTIGASGAGAVTTPTVSSPPDQLVGMGDGYVDVPVTLSAPGQSTVTVSYATANATAAAGTSCDNEYVAASGTLTFTPGQTTQTVRVGLNNCKITGFYFFSFNLSSPVGATIVRPQSVIDIVGDAAGSGTPQLDRGAATVDASAGSVLVPVLLNGTAGQASTSTVTVGYATADGSAKAGTDYTSTSGTLTFVPGETVQNVSVPILDPSGSKPTRSFTLTLSSPTNATLGQVTATVTIGASGAGAVTTPTVSSPPDQLVGMGDGYVDVPVTLSAPGQSTVTVSYATANATAAAGTSCDNEYVAASGTLTFTPGQTTQTVRVGLNNCKITGFYFFSFNLSSPVGATIVRPQSVIDIVGDAAGSGTPQLDARPRPSTPRRARCSSQCSSTARQGKPPPRR